MALNIQFRLFFCLHGSTHNNYIYLRTYRVFESLTQDLIWHCIWTNDPFYSEEIISGDTSPQDIPIILLIALLRNFQLQRIMKWHFKGTAEALTWKWCCVSTECHASGPSKLITIRWWWFPKGGMYGSWDQAVAVRVTLITIIPRDSLGYLCFLSPWL